MRSQLKGKKSANKFLTEKLIFFFIICCKREKLDCNFGHFLAKHVLRLGLPWQQLRSLLIKKYNQLMCNRLKIKVTKFQESYTNRF